MTKLVILVTAAMLNAVAMFAQIPPQGSAFQQPGWIGAPGGSLVTYPTLRPDGQFGPVVGKPFSGSEERHTVQTLADGTHVENSTSSLFYRDAQGRMRSEGPTQALIYDPIAGFTMNLDLRNKSYSKGPIRKDGSVSIAVIGNRTSISSHGAPVTSNAADLIFNRLSPPREEQAPGKAAHRALIESIHSRAATEVLPAQMVNGIQSRGSRITETIPVGTFGNDRDIKIVSERWVSDDLQVLVKSVNSDPRFGVTTYELKNVTQGPPDPALFQVPADYQLTNRVMLNVGGGVPGTVKK